MAFQGATILVLTIGLAGLLYYMFTANGTQEEAYGYGNSRGANGSDFGRFPNYYNHEASSSDQSSNNREQIRRRRRQSKILQNDDTACTICLYEILDQRKTLPCNHSFHDDCIKMWRLQGPVGPRNTCPMCRITF